MVLKYCKYLKIKLMLLQSWIYRKCLHELEDRVLKSPSDDGQLFTWQPGRAEVSATS